MKSNNADNTPFKNLGEHLQHIRHDAKQSVSEVSGAVEIDEITLERIEEGRERPAEDILLLLISHFAMRDDDAVRLWELAGYDRPVHSKPSNEDLTNRSLVMVMALDSRIIYCDKVEIVANTNGVVLNFLQAPDGPYPPQTVSRIGMSREQATNLNKVLEQSLIQSAKYIEKNSQKNISSPKPKNNPKSDRQ